MSGGTQSSSYTRWLTRARTFQSAHGVVLPHCSSPTASTRRSNSSSARAFTTSGSERSTWVPGSGSMLMAAPRSTQTVPQQPRTNPSPAAMRRFGPPTIRRTTVSPAPPGPIDDRWTYSGTPSLSRHHSLVVLVGGAEPVCRPALGRWRRAQRAEHPARGPRCVLRCGGAARQTVTARQAGRGGGTRSARCRFDRELRSADIWRPLRHADQGGTVSLPACRLSLSPLPRLLRREQFDHGAAS